MSSFWHDEATLYGMQVKAAFFDGDAVKTEADLAKRVLPFLHKAAPKTMFTEEDRQNFYYGELVAQPDAVFEHGDGLISVEYKYAGYKSHPQKQWQHHVRLKDMLQCVICGYALAQNYQKVVACVLRYHNVCYLLVPQPEIIHTMLDLIPLAKDYHQEPRRVSASQLAQFSMDRIRSAYPGPEDQRAVQGRAAHETMLRR